MDPRNKREKPETHLYIHNRNQTNALQEDGLA